MANSFFKIKQGLNLANYATEGDLSSIANPQVGDLVSVGNSSVYTYNGTTWTNIASGGSGGGVTSVNGDTGPAVYLDSGEIPENGNLYFTDGRAQTAAVVNSTAGSETTQAASVQAMKNYVAANAPVSSVNTQTGAVELTSGDVPEGAGSGGGWSSKQSLNIPRTALAGAGTSTAALAFGGSANFGWTDSTESYDGVNWSIVSPMSIARDSLAGAGIQSAALAFGGSTASGFTDATEAYNGSSWSSVSPMSGVRILLAGAGLQNAALAFGGINGSTNLASSESFNGSSWSSAPSMNTAKYGLGGIGTQIAAVAFGGSTNSGYSNTTEIYDGSSWSISGNLSVARERLAGAGLQNAGLAFGGEGAAGKSSITETFNGSTWSTVENLSVARSGLAGVGIQSAALTFGGYSNTTLAITESYATASPINYYFSDARAQTAAVVNSTAGSETNQAPSVSAMKAYVSSLPASGVTSVNGDSGPVVSLDSGEIPEGSNLYFTDARAQTAAVVNSMAGSESDQAPSVSSVKGAIQFLPENARYVAKNGSDVIGNGSEVAPYQTIQAALDSLPAPVVGADIPDCVIYVYPGVYNETLNWTRSNTHIVGMQAPRKNIQAVSIKGGIDFNIAIAEPGGMFQNISSISNILVSSVSSGTRDVINYNGSNQVILQLVNCQIYQDSVGCSAISMDNTAASLSRLYLDNTVVQCVGTGAGHAIDLIKGNLFSAFNSEIYRLYSTDVTARAIKLSNNSTVANISNGQIIADKDYVIEMAGTGNFTAALTLIQNSTSNKSGILIAAGTVCTILDCSLNIAAGTGKAIDGSAGAVLYYASNIYIANTSVASAITKLQAATDTTTSVIAEGSNQYFTTARARTAAVVDSTAGSETDQAASVSAMKSYVAANLPSPTSTVTTAGYALSSTALNTQTTSYVLQASDNGRIVIINSGSAVNVTVPSGLDVGFNCMVVQIGAGQVTMVASGTTLNSANGLKISAQHGALSIISYSSNVYNVSGNTTT